MKRLRSLFLLFFTLLLIPAAASAALKPDDDPTIVEGLRDKGFDWLKDKASDAGKSWIFDTGQSQTMHDILVAAEERSNGPGHNNKGLCQYGVMSKASSILDDINVKTKAKMVGLFAFDTTAKMASLASGFGAAAGEGNAINWLVQQYTDAAKDAGKDAVFDRIKKLFVDEEKPEFELYETKGKSGECDYELRAVWDIVHGTYRVYIAGDCHCTNAGQFGLDPTPLGKWWISFEGRLTLKADKDAKTSSWIVGPVENMDFDAQCACSTRALRQAFVRVTKEEVKTAGGGGTSTTPSGPPPLPRAGRKVCKECQGIQDEIDADTEALDDAKREVDRLSRQLEDANTRLAGKQEQLKDARANPKNYSITPEQIEDQVRSIEAEIKGIYRKNAELYAEQVRLMAALHDLARRLDECLKAHCAPGHSSIPKASNEQFAAVTPAPRKCDPQQLSSFASTVLAVHNSERAAVGAQPLCWNATLARDATAYAEQLAQTRQLVHAPRDGRGVERENLLQALPYWGAAQMVGVWVAEKRYFQPGIFPNVCGGRDWSQCAHYTQMIWPTTTDIGCGEAPGGGFEWVVCRYSPGGNKDGKPVGKTANQTERG